MHLVSVYIFLQFVVCVLEYHFFLDCRAYFVKNSQSAGVRYELFVLG